MTTNYRPPPYRDAADKFNAAIEEIEWGLLDAVRLAVNATDFGSSRILIDVIEEIRSIPKVTRDGKPEPTPVPR